jgi:hypothetical protein
LRIERGSAPTRLVVRRKAARGLPQTAKPSVMLDGWAAGHDQDNNPSRGRVTRKIGRPKNDRCLGRLSTAPAWAGLSDWLKMR